MLAGLQGSAESSMSSVASYSYFITAVVMLKHATNNAYLEINTSTFTGGKEEEGGTCSVRI